MDRRHEATTVFLKPGDWFVGDAGYRVRTLLGSCVSIVLWHPATRIGAMSHCLLGRPSRIGQQGMADGRFVDGALDLMDARLCTLGVPIAACQCKLFGGGNMFPGDGAAAGSDIGRSNGQAARELLHARGIAIVAESLYGIGHRVILFDIASGNVWVQQVDPRQSPRTEEPAA